MNETSDPNNYSYDELLQILGINTLNPTLSDIDEISKKIITKLTNSGKLDLAEFIKKVEAKIISAMPSAETTEMQTNWYKNQYPSQTDKTQMDKITDRKNKIDVFDAGDSMAINQQQLGITNTHDIPIIQGILNPNLKNIINRTALIDSRFRSNIIPHSNNVNSLSINTNFTVELSEQLTNVISLKLGSVQLPASWYTFDDNIGNTCFKYQEGIRDPITINIPPGNYTVYSLNSLFQSFTPALTIHLYAYNQNGLLSFYSTNTEMVTLTFYDSGSFNKCSTGCNAQMKINQNFGWYLGCRPYNNTELSIAMQPYSSSPLNVYPLQALPNFNGPLYFLLVVDDFNNNSTDNSLITASSTNTTPDLPSYYSTSRKNANNTFSTACNNTNIPFLTRSSPRTLTNSQLYTANEILYNTRQKINTKLICSSIPDVLAIIPVDGVNKLQSINTLISPTPSGQPISYNSSQITTPYISYGSSLSVRTYFGPVNIERIHVKLLDDTGNIVNLNGVDWSFSLIAEQLYQY